MVEDELCAVEQYPDHVCIPLGVVRSGRGQLSHGVQLAARRMPREHGKIQAVDDLRRIAEGRHAPQGRTLVANVVAVHQLKRLRYAMAVRDGKIPFLGSVEELEELLFRRPRALLAPSSLSAFLAAALRCRGLACGDR